MTGLSDGFIFQPYKRPEWFSQAKCRNQPTELFYPSDGNKAQKSPAFAICHSCPIEQECLDYALSFPIYLDRGIWGGKSERARRTMRSKLRLVKKEEIPE